LRLTKKTHYLNCCSCYDPWMFKRAIIFGSSRGLGRALGCFIASHLEGIEEVWLCGRKEALLEGLAREMAQGNKAEGVPPFLGRVKVESLDLSSEKGQEGACQILKKHDFDLVIYSAGGGPHGEFAAKEWKDHFWSLNVNLISPLRLIHTWLEVGSERKSGTFVVVGSRIAENSPDPLAASYGAGKTGLLGFMASLQPELEGKMNRVWLFSPGYMDTDMLPLNAKVRAESKLMSADAAAQAMLRWIKKDGPWHRVLN
jgi:short-subunit dehydrogenase